MNLIEALRTGCPIRRPIAKHLGACRTGWLGNEFVRSLLTSERSTGVFGLCQTPLVTEQDLMASDWVARTPEWETENAKDEMRY